MTADALRLRLEPGNPYDLPREDLEGLATLLRDEQGLDVEVAVPEERGYGVTFGEVLRIYLDVAEVTAASGTILAPFALAVRWARQRWRHDRDAHPDRNPRPRFVSLLGPDGTELKSVRIDLPEGEAVEL